MIDFTADIDSRDRGKSSALHSACQHGHLELASSLISKGASLSERDQWNCEPLKYAILRGHTKIIECMKQAGARLCEESRLDLEYRLCRSAAEGDQTSVEALISAGRSAPSHFMLINADRCGCRNFGQCNRLFWPFRIASCSWQRPCGFGAATCDARRKRARKRRVGPHRGRPRHALRSWRSGRDPLPRRVVGPYPAIHRPSLPATSVSAQAPSRR